jgi:Spy/CpxP family protein refolding chaperone
VRHLMGASTNPASVRVLAAACAIAIVSLASLAMAGADKWWLASDVQRELGLTARQVTELNAIFEKTLSERLRLRLALDSLEAELARAMSDGNEPQALSLIPKVESARTARNTERTMMLIRMYRVLTPGQRHRLNSRVLLERTPPPAGYKP